MKISTKGRYALRLMIDIGKNQDGGSVSLHDSALRQEISMKYLERMCGMLCHAGLLASSRGVNGGYRLVKPSQDYSCEEILQAAGEDLYPVACMKGGKNTCPRYDICSTIGFWEGLDRTLREYLRGYTLKDLIENNDYKHENNFSEV